MVPAAPCFLSKCTSSGVPPLSVTFFDLTSSVCFCSVNIIFPGGVAGSGGESEPVSSAGGGSLPFFLEPAIVVQMSFNFKVDGDNFLDLHASIAASSLLK